MSPPAQELNAQFPGAQAPSLGEVRQQATQPDPAVTLGPSLTPEDRGAWRSFSPSWQRTFAEGVKASCSGDHLPTPASLEKARSEHDF